MIGTAKKQTKLLNAIATFWPILLAIFGTGCLCYATFLQLTAAPQFSEEKTRQQRGQLVVDIFEGQRDQWRIAVNQELAREKRDPAVLAVAALEALRSTARWRAVLGFRAARSKEEYQSMIAQRDAIIARGLSLYQAGEIDELLRMLNGIGAVVEGRKEIEQYDDAANVKMVETYQADEAVSKRLLTAQIVGSILMLISVVGSSLQTAALLGTIQGRLEKLATARGRVPE